MAAGEDGIGDNPVDGTPGQQCWIELMNLLLDSPYSADTERRD